MGWGRWAYMSVFIFRLNKKNYFNKKKDSCDRKGGGRRTRAREISHSLTKKRLQLHSSLHLMPPPSPPPPSLLPPGLSLLPSFPSLCAYPAPKHTPKTREMEPVAHIIMRRLWHHLVPSRQRACVCACARVCLRVRV